MCTISCRRPRFQHEQQRSIRWAEFKKGERFSLQRYIAALGSSVMELKQNDESWLLLSCFFPLFFLAHVEETSWTGEPYDVESLCINPTGRSCWHMSADNCPECYTHRFQWATKMESLSWHESVGPCTHEHPSLFFLVCATLQPWRPFLFWMNEKRKVSIVKFIN